MFCKKSSCEIRRGLCLTISINLYGKSPYRNFPDFFRIFFIHGRIMVWLPNWNWLTGPRTSPINQFQWGNRTTIRPWIKKNPEESINYGSGLWVSSWDLCQVNFLKKKIFHYWQVLRLYYSQRIYIKNKKSRKSPVKGRKIFKRKVRPHCKRPKDAAMACTNNTSSFLRHTQPEYYSVRTYS